MINLFTYTITRHWFFAYPLLETIENGCPESD